LSWNSLLAIAAGLFAGLVGFAALLHKPRSVASWAFFAGMETLAIESALDGISLTVFLPEKVIYWQTLVSVAKSFFPGLWLLFSLTYLRGNYREFLLKWRFLLTAAFLLPVTLAVGFQTGSLHLFANQTGGERAWLSFSGTTKTLSIFILVTIVLILLNLEKTFRSTVGTMRWRIKFLVLGVAIVFGARIHIESQRLLFSEYNPALADIQTGALLIGCTLMVVAHIRNGFAEINVYPSQIVLQSSFTLLLAGGYLFVVGVLAQIVAHLGGAGSLQTQAFLVLLGTAVLAVILISDRFRHQLQRFVSRHFARPQHDFRRIWTLMAQGMSSVVDRGALCNVAARLISENFNVLSVSIWLTEGQSGRLALGASTSRAESEGCDSDKAFALPDPALRRLRELNYPFDLDTIDEDWAVILRRIGSPQFRNGGNRISIPLLAADRLLGVATLADRVSGTSYTLEELDLLKCIGNQVAAGLLNLQLGEELVLAKQFEAFQTMSAFFVHDLKNVVSSLSLTLQNLPVHFDDPECRTDALKAIVATVNRINHLIGRLSVLRSKIELKPVETNLNQLVAEALESLDWAPEIEVINDLHPIPKIFADPEQLQDVVINLLLNARDVLAKGGQVRVQTSERDGHAVLTVGDNGCGMTQAFLRDSLFRPFHTTKREGLGIGLLQSRMIVEAHRGFIQVESELGKGTTFCVVLPLAGDKPRAAEAQPNRPRARPRPRTREALDV
jgi:putative PEP-CTERM system histidine kinase